LGRLALVNGTVGVTVAPRGRLFLVLHLTVRRWKIVEIDRGRGCWRSRRSGSFMAALDVLAW
jgi:hypothetical protein